MTWRKFAQRIAHWTLPQGIDNLIRTHLLSKKSPAVSQGLGFLYGQNWKGTEYLPASIVGNSRNGRVPNPIEVYFDSHTEGRGVWKFRHYFDIYHRHLQKFVGTEVHIVEIGVYSGGSLRMWKDYFGAKCHVYGVDIEAACKVYEEDSVRILVGDQADRDFWCSFRERVPRVDIVIDDGGHLAEQQVASLEELLPHLRWGGVYICEDITGIASGFSSYLNGLVQNLNSYHCRFEVNNPERHQYSPALPFQSAIDSVHLYPFVAVVEKRDTPLDEFVAPKHGTEWQPFL